MSTIEKAALAKKYNLGNVPRALYPSSSKIIRWRRRIGTWDCHQDLTVIKDAIGPYWRGLWLRMWFLVRLVLLAKPSTCETTNNAVRYFASFMFLGLLDRYSASYPGTRKRFYTSSKFCSIWFATIEIKLGKKNWSGRRRFASCFKGVEFLSSGSMAKETGKRLVIRTWNS